MPRKIAKYRTAPPDFGKLPKLVDQFLLETVMILNAKGLVTYNCCSGYGPKADGSLHRHEDYGNYNSDPYICFRVDNDEFFKTLVLRLVTIDRLCLRRYGCAKEGPKEYVVEMAERNSMLKAKTKWLKDVAMTVKEVADGFPDLYPDHSSRPEDRGFPWFFAM